MSVVNVKGGSGKTTTSVGIASAIFDKYKNCMLIDADKQGSAIGWADKAEFEFLTLANPTYSIHKEVKKINIDNIVIYTPPGELGVIASALKSSNITIVPINPTGVDLDQLIETINLIEDVKVLNDIEYYILLNQVVKNTIALREITNFLNKKNLPVLSNTIPQSQSLARCFGNNLISNDLCIYINILNEIESRE
jgi:chromosome partitioning protein